MAKRIKFSGITCLAGKMQFKLLSQGPLAEGDKTNAICTVQSIITQKKHDDEIHSSIWQAICWRGV